MAPLCAAAGARNAIVHGAVARRRPRSALAWLVAHPRRRCSGRASRGLSLGGVHRDDAAAGRGRRPAQRHRRQPDHDGDRRRRSARRSASSPAPTWPNTAATRRLTTVVRFINDILLVGAVDRHRPVRLRDHGRADGPFLGLGRRASRSPCSSFPVVVRTTEDMLLLVPNALREAATALGAPRCER